jgi:predicted extracellular nuclease
MQKPTTRWGVAVVSIALSFFALIAIVRPRSAAAAISVFINEIHYDNTGTDAGEAIEVAGPAGTNLSGWSLVLYNGAGGAPYDTKLLTGIIPDQQNGFGTLSFTYPVNGIQNGAPDGIALVNGTSVVQFLSYEGAFTAVGGPANGMPSVDIGVSENGTEPIGQSLRLSGSGQFYEDFHWNAPATATFGAVNTGQNFGAGVSLSINDATVTEGNAGSVIATFTVSLSSSAHAGVTFDISTADDSATTANNDYVLNTLLTQSIPGGSSTFQFEVTVNGDVAFEPNETFLVNVTNVIGATVSDGTGVGTILNDDCPPVPADIVISQVYGGGGNGGATFTHDFIELFNQGPTPVNLSGWSVQYIAAAGTGTWAVTPLSGSIAPGGYYLIQEAQGAGGTTALPAPDAVGTIAMAAGAGKVALSSSTTPFSGQCPTCFVDFVGYGGANCFEGGGPTSAPSNTTAALRKRGGCFDSDNNNIDFSIGPPNPRNTASPTRDCGFTAAAIHDIQGPGLVTPLLGLDVSTTGIVTAKKTNGFFLQAPDADVDLNPDTSEGIFVFTSGAPAVSVGDSVTVTGTASEFFDLTQLDSSLPGDVTVNTSGNSLPGVTTFTTSILNPSGPRTQLERFEGMRMHADFVVSVAPTNEFGETFTVLQGVARPLREPGIEISLPVPPDPTSGVPDCCIPRWDENPERIMIDSDGLAGSTFFSVTSNVTLSDVTGPLDFTFGDYKVLPETAPAATANMSAVPVPAPLAGEFTIGGFNIENFNNNPTQRHKAALAIRDVMRLPDIIGTIEIFDLADLQALADEITTISGVVYEARLIEADGTTEDADQDVGFLVKTSRIQIDSVTQIELSGCDGTAANCNTFIDPNTGDPALLNDRPPLVLHATVDASGPDPRQIIVVVNHTRSFIDIEAVGGEGVRVRAKRKAQAEFLGNLLQQLQTDNPATPVISIGDYNAYQFSDGFTDPVATIKGTPTPDDQVVVDESPDLVNPNFVNLTDGLPADQRYSFIFAGTPQAIDHFLLNTVAVTYLQRYAVARNNSDFPEGPTFAADATRPERCSDHDMPVGYFKFPPRLTVVGPSKVWIGLKNSDDVGTKFDLKAEVLKNGSVISTGQLNDVPGGSSGFNNAALRTISLALAEPVEIFPGDTVSFRLSVRVAATSGHVSGTARLWYNGAPIDSGPTRDAGSRLAATIGGSAADYFLRTGFVLSTVAGSPRTSIDVNVNRNVGGNPFKPFGTWSKTF